MVSNYQYDPNEYSNVTAERNNKVGTIESMLSGIASGLIAIPKGFFSLGASLMDLGVNSGKAARVEQWFDDLTEFDEKAEATAAGTNIDIPDGGMLFSEGMFIDLPTTSPANSITHVTLLFEGGAAA